METCNSCIYGILPQKRVTLKKGSVIFKEGNEIDNTYIIKDGYVKLEKIYLNGEIKIVDIFRTNDFLGLLSILKDAKEYPVTAVALTDVTLDVIGKDLAKKQYHTSPVFKETCMNCASNRLGVFQQQLFDFSNLSTEDKVYNLLNHLYLKFGYQKEGRKFIKLPISRIELANMIGVRRETLSRKLKELDEEGIITTNKNIIEITSM